MRAGAMDKSIRRERARSQDRPPSDLDYRGFRESRCPEGQRGERELPRFLRRWRAHWRSIRNSEARDADAMKRIALLEQTLQHRIALLERAVQQRINLLERTLQKRTEEAVVTAVGSVTSMLQPEQAYQEFEPAKATRERSEYFQLKVLNILKNIRPYSITLFNKIRIGSRNDGGYMCIDDFSSIKRCVSCGISNNDDFDADLAKRGIEVLQFDHTVDAAPSQHENMKFFKERIVAAPRSGGRTLSSLVQRSSDSELSILLKLDIEGDEWPVFDAMPERDINQFRQIIAEFHGFDCLPDSVFEQRMSRVLEKLNRSFFVCHVHANNHGGMVLFGGVPVPRILELTFANRKVYEPVESGETFPTALDAPNDPSSADYRLGSFRF